MKPPPDAERAARVVFEGALAGTLAAEALRGPYDLDQGLALQLAVLELWKGRGERLGGYKVGLTSGAARDSMGVGFRPFGYVLASRIFRSGARIERARISRPRLEVELCLRIGSPLRGAEVTREQARAAVAGVAAAFEINELRVEGDAEPALRLADDLSQWGIVVGEERPPELASRDHRVELSRDGEPRARAGPGHPIDDHFESLAALARRLHRFDLGLDAGQRVITGAYCRDGVAGPGRWQGSVGDLGDVEVEFF